MGGLAYCTSGSLSPWLAAHFSVSVQWVGRMAGRRPALCIVGLMGVEEQSVGDTFLLLQDGDPEMSSSSAGTGPCLLLG